jgi:hypothetical protein
MGAVEPGDFSNELVSLVTETDWVDIQVIEALGSWVDDQGLGLDGHVLWVHPGVEKFSVWTGVPWVLLVLVG